MSNILSPSIISTSKLLTFTPLVEVEKNNQEEQFTTDWFSKHIPIWLDIFKRFGFDDENKILKVFELGSWEGRSTCFILNHLMKHPLSELIVCDTFQGSYENKEYDYLDSLFTHFSHNVTLTKKQHQLKVIRGSTLTEIPKMELFYHNYFDFIYVDASHTAKDTLIDAMNSFCLLSVGGIMIFDDYLGGEVSKYYKSPKYGIDTFLNFYKELIQIVFIGYQLIIQKITSIPL